LLSWCVTTIVTGDLVAQKYRLERLLGEGAQGSVWMAENVALGCPVAIKLVHGDPENPAPILRLEKEARAAAQLGHPAVVRVFDLGRTPGGDAFIVMEYLEGENLGERLNACGKLPAIEAVRALLPIADALHVAHARGIVHRDLKPENVFLAKSGVVVQPKLLDFGIAKFRPERSENAITQIGTLVGSPSYVAPEQATCREDVSQAADIWSFSVVLYECLTGQVPFAANDCRELFRRIVEDAPEPILSQGVEDEELWEIVRRGLEKAPEERWPSIVALGRALARWLRAQGVEDDVSGVLLESKWLGKNRTLPPPIEPSSRSVHAPTFSAADSIAGLSSPVRTPLVGGIALGVALGIGGALCLAWPFANPRDEAPLERAASEPSRPSLEPLELRPAARHPATPPVIEPATELRTPSAKLAVPHAERPAPPRQRSRERRSDLLNPY
jgi:serine/threonine protein kinase